LVRAFLWVMRTSVASLIAANTLEGLEHSCYGYPDRAIKPFLFASVEAVAAWFYVDRRIGRETIILYVAVFALVVAGFALGLFGIRDRKQRARLSTLLALR